MQKWQYKQVISKIEHSEQILNEHGLQGWEAIFCVNEIDGLYIFTLKRPISNKRGSNFKPPTVEEVKAYCEQRGNSVAPSNFHSFYESKNWMVGRNKMKDWRAAIRTWENKTTNYEEIIV